MPHLKPAERSPARHDGPARAAFYPLAVLFQDIVYTFRMLGEGVNDGIEYRP